MKRGLKSLLVTHWRKEATVIRVLTHENYFFVWSQVQRIGNGCTHKHIPSKDDIAKSRLKEVDDDDDDDVSRVLDDSMAIPALYEDNNIGFSWSQEDNKPSQHERWHSLGY